MDEMNGGKSQGSGEGPCTFPSPASASAPRKPRLRVAAPGGRRRSRPPRRLPLATAPRLGLRRLLPRADGQPGGSLGFERNESNPADVADHIGGFSFLGCVASLLFFQHLTGGAGKFRADLLRLSSASGRDCERDMQSVNKCELCELRDYTQHYCQFVHPFKFAILDCDSCDTPMAVLGEHRKEPTEDEKAS